MMEHLRPQGRIARADRLRRRLGFDHNDLRRDVDRTQRAAGLTLLLSFAFLAPLGTGPVVRSVYAYGIEKEHRETRTRHQVVATVVQKLDSAPNSHMVRYSLLRWSEPNGTTRSKLAVADRSDKPGGSRRIWVDSTGNYALRPRTHGQTLTDAWFAGGGAAGAIGLPLLGGYLLLRRRCDEHRGRMWDESWAQLDARQTP